MTPEYKELLAKIGAEQFTFIPGSAQHDALIDALDAAYKAGAESMLQPPPADVKEIVDSVLNRHDSFICHGSGGLAVLHEIAAVAMQAVRQSANDEADLVCKAVEDVAERQMNNTADAAIFAFMISLPVTDIARTEGVTVDFDWVREAIGSYQFHKSYLPGGLVRFKIEPK